MLKRTKIYTIILSVLLITLILSMGVFALEDHSTHYTKSFLSGTYRWQYVNGDINIGYYYEKLGTKDYSSRISNAANSWTSFSYSPFDSIYSTTKANCKLLITSNNYGNVQFMGTTNYQSSPKKIQMNEYFHIYEGYDYNSYESVALHEM